MLSQRRERLDKLKLNKPTTNDNSKTKRQNSCTWTGNIKTSNNAPRSEATPNSL